MKNRVIDLQQKAKNLTVLFVDDDVAIVERMQKYLQKFFHTVLLAYDGEEALEILETNAVDILITDISMPKLNGIELIGRVRAFNEKMAVIILSAFSDFDYLKSAISYGIDGYMLKPVDYEALNRELHKCVVRIAIEAENKRYKEHLEELLEQKQHELVESYRSTMVAMVDIIESRDSYTAGHSQRVAKYAKQIAVAMELSTKETELVYKAGLLHDIGKIAVPDSILLNPHTLSQREYTIIKQHVQIGVDILKKIPIFEDVAEIVLAHHEHYDGSGYPRGLKKEQVPLLSHILVVADSFDAMTTSRVYKGQKSVEESLKELKMLSGRQFHPKVVEGALKALKGVRLAGEIIQEPTNELEREKFFYFFKDTVTRAYNKKYLEVTLLQNSYTNKYRYVYLVFLHNFSNYNKQYGWEVGDRLLVDIADVLSDLFEDALVFRIQGDDFVLLSKEKLSLAEVFKRFEFLQQDKVYITYNEIKLKKNHASSFDEIVGFRN